MKLQAAILAIWIGASTALLHAQTPGTNAPSPVQGPSGARPEPSASAPQEPSTNWTEVSTPGIRALAPPGAFSQYAPSGGVVGCQGCPGNKSGSCLHRLIAWATYCPKERVCSCLSCCNSCGYKGALPIYLIPPVPKCVEGSGIHNTFPNPTCAHGCKGCAAGCAGH